MTDKMLSNEVRGRFDEWINCIKDRNFQWMEDNFHDSLTVTAHPFPTFVVDKAGFIEADRHIQEVDIDLLDVQAREIGNIVISQTVAKIGTEKVSGHLGDGLPSGDEITAALTGKTVVYATAWRRVDGRLMCFDHHLVGPVD